MTHIRRACPALSAPMETGDGLLVRILPSGPIPLRAFAGLCAAALTQGNGTMEISARGSVQIRGLTPVTAPSFATAVSALRLDIGDGVPVLADPLPGDPTALIDANALAAELRNAIASAALALAPKLSVIVDGGGKLHLDALNADIRIRAGATADGPLLHLAVAGRRRNGLAAWHGRAGRGASGRDAPACSDCRTRRASTGRRCAAAPRDRCVPGGHRDPHRACALVTAPASRRDGWHAFSQGRSLCAGCGAHLRPRRGRDASCTDRHRPCAWCVMGAAGARSLAAARTFQEDDDQDDEGRGATAWLCGGPLRCASPHRGVSRCAVMRFGLDRRADHRCGDREIR